MVNSSSSIYLAPVSQTMFHTPPRLPVTPPRKYQPPIPRSTTPQSLGSIGRSRALSTNADANADQGRITMQTRVAVRDTTPHRFQIIPLREVKGNCKPAGASGPQSKYLNESKRQQCSPIRPSGAEQPIPTPLKPVLQHLVRQPQSTALIFRVPAQPF